MSRRPPPALLLAVAMYLGLRALVLHGDFDSVCLPNYELTLQGNIAKIASGGWFGPPLHQYYDNCGGHLVTGLFAAPLFAVFGDSYLVLKLVPVLLGLGTLLLIWYALDRWLDRRAAVLAVLLFAVGPPTLTKYSMLAKGNHFENIFFQLSILVLFFRLHTGARSSRRLFATAFAAGFGVFFYFGTLVLLALLCFVHVLVRGPWRALLDLRIALPGFALGIAPLAWIHLSSGARPQAFLQANLGGLGSSTIRAKLDRLGDFFTDILPRAGCFADIGPVPGRVAEWLFLAAFTASWLALLPAAARGVLRSVASLRSSRNDRESAERERFEALKMVPFVLYLPLFALIVAVSSFQFKAYAPPVEVGQFRYLVPHFAFATMLIGAAVAHLAARPAALQHRLSGALAAAALATTLFTLPIVDWSFERPGIGTRYHGYYFSYLNMVLLRDTWVDDETGRIRWDEDRLLAQMEELPWTVRHAAWFGVGHHLAWVGTMPARESAPRPATPSLQLGTLLADVPVPFRIDAARGAGSFVRGLAKKPKLAVQKLGRWLPDLLREGHPMLHYLGEGLAFESEFPLARMTSADLAHSRALGQNLPAGLRRGWMRGRGIVCGRLLARGIRSDRQAVLSEFGRIPPAGASEFWLGVGWGLAERGEPTRLHERWVEWIPAEHLEAALVGFGAGLRHLHGAEGCGGFLKALARTVEERDLGRIEKGMRWPAYPAPIKP